jgi:hypothetical protein
VSNSLAIAAVTSALKVSLADAFQTGGPPGTQITSNPPDKARLGANENQVNIFLFHATVSGAWRNADMPLPLVLQYLVTAYGQDDEDTLGQQVLGRAMSVLHDRPILDRDEIRAALAGNDLADQVESVRLTLQAMTLEEMSKLWTTFQTQYRLSVAYEASVVLLESSGPVRSPLPALRRGESDAGPQAQADTVLPFPTVASVVVVSGQPSVLLGGEVEVVGNHLAGPDVSVQLESRRLLVPIVIPSGQLVAASDTSVTFVVPDDPAAVPPGVYGVSVVTGGPQSRSSKPMKLTVAPEITQLPGPVVPDGLGAFTVEVACRPQVLPTQQAALVIGQRQFQAVARAAATATLTFAGSGLAAGEYRVRLRVDDVESLLVDRSVTPPGFDETMKITVQ